MPWRLKKLCHHHREEQHMEQLQKRVCAPLDFLEQLQEADKNELHSLGKIRTFDKNDFIFKENGNDFNVYVLKSGRVKIFVSSAEGRDVVLWFAVAGEIFGLAESFQEKPRMIYARAAESCEVLCIAHTQFKEWLATHPEGAFSLMKIMALRMRELGQRFLSLASGNIQSEIAQLLVRLGASHGRFAGQHIHMGIPLTEQDIADMVGTTRQGVSTCLAQMKRQGIVHFERHFLIIKQPEGLQQIAKGLRNMPAIERRTNKRAWLSRASQ